MYKQAKNCFVTEVPTGKIIVLPEASPSGLLMECLSLADFGQNANVKAAFLGLDNPTHTRALMPLEEKWVITLSTQSSCMMGCTFCDVPRKDPNHPDNNLSVESLLRQFKAALSLYPDVKYTKRLNIHFARMGEPTMNMANIIKFASVLRKEVPRVANWPIHMVVSTIAPIGRGFAVMAWYNYLSTIGVDGNLQLSINSTSNEWRRKHMPAALPLENLGGLCREMSRIPSKRKFTLNFAVTEQTEIDAKYLARLFSPDNFMVKLTPLHQTKASAENGHKYCESYTDHEAALIAAGFDVLIFYSSAEEEDGIITCGNAMIGDSTLKAPYKTYAWRYE